MAATTVDRNSPALHIERQKKLPLANAPLIPAGAIVCTNAAGAAVNGADTAALKMEGRAAHAADYAAGDRFIVVERGTFYWNNNGNVTQAHIGTLVTIVDNQTVGLVADTTNDIGAGYVDAVDANGVAVTVLGGKPDAA